MLSRGFWVAKRDGDRRPATRRSAGLLAAACALGLGAACASAPEGNETTAFQAAPIDVDPLTVRGPLYEISIDYVQTNQPADPPLLVFAPHYGLGGNLYRNASIDKIRVGLAAELSSETHPVSRPHPVDTFECDIGEDLYVGDPLLDPYNVGDPAHTPLPRRGYTVTPGTQVGSGRYSDGIYRTCYGTGNAIPAPGRAYGKPGDPLRLNAAVPVRMDETLNVYATLTVLDPRDVVADPAVVHDPVGTYLSQLGGMYATAGSIVSFVPAVGTAAGAVLGGIGSVLKAASSVASGLFSHTEVPVGTCQTARTLIPGSGVGQDGNAVDKDDATSPLFRIPLDGRALYEQTANEELVLHYNLDFGTFAGSTMCSRPNTDIQFRIRRVRMEGSPAFPVASRGGPVVASAPDRVDAFGVSASGRIFHDQFGNNTSCPVGAGDSCWAPGESVDEHRYEYTPASQDEAVSPAAGQSTSAFGSLGVLMSFQMFAPNTPLTAVVVDPLRTVLLGVDNTGTLRSSERTALPTPSAGGPFDGDVGQGWSSWTAIVPAPNLDPPKLSAADLTDLWLNGSGEPQPASSKAAALFPAKAQIAAVGEASGRVSAFMVGNDGNVYRAMGVVTDGDLNWVGLAPIAAQANMPPGGGLAVVSLSPSDMRVYGIANSGRLVSWRGYPSVTPGPNAAAWNFSEVIPATGPEIAAPPGAALAVVARERNRTDVFVADLDGAITTASWDGDCDSWSGGWVTDPFTVTPGSSVAVVSRKISNEGEQLACGQSGPNAMDAVANDHMDVFAVSVDGYIVHAQWAYGTNAGGWNQAAVSRLQTRANPLRPLGAVAPYPGAIYVAATAPDGAGLVETWVRDPDLSAACFWQRISGQPFGTLNATCR